MNDVPHYNINLFWHAASATWVADVPDLKGCSAHGASPGEAAREAEVAMALWIETALEQGQPVPEPRYRPAIYAAREAA